MVIDEHNFEPFTSNQLEGPGGAGGGGGTGQPGHSARKRAWTLPIHTAWKKSPLPSPAVGFLSDKEDSEFLEGIKPAFTVVQLFGLFPVRKPSSSRHVSFRWASPRVLWCAFIILASATESVFAVLRMFETGVRYYSSVNAVFFVLMTVAQVLFLRLSARWPGVVQFWAQIESSALRGLPVPEGLNRRMRATTAVALGLGLVEHSLSIATTFIYVWPCFTRRGFRLLFQGYFMTKYLKTFTIVTYSVTKALVVLFVQITCVFLWNYIDLFISLIAMGLSAQFRQLNTELKSVEGQAQSNDFWRKKRKTYNALSDLVHKVDTEIGSLVVLSFACDLYFVCLQLLSIVNSPSMSVYHDAFFYFSMAYLLARSSFMSYVAANIHEESKKPSDVLYSVPSEGYTVEAERFLTQVTSDDICITGCNFFSISRSLILKVAGTIVTYVIVLVQFGDKNANPDIAQSNGTVSCTCEDIKVYDC